MASNRRLDALETKHKAARKVDWSRDIVPTLARQSARAHAILAERLHMPISDEVIDTLKGDTPALYASDTDVNTRWMLQQGLKPEQVARDSRALLTAKLNAIIERRKLTERMN